MIYYDVYVCDRVTCETVQVGSLLVRSEALDLIECLERFNATDLEIYKKDVRTI